MVAPAIIAVAGVLAAVAGGATIYRCCFRSSTSLSRSEHGSNRELVVGADEFSKDGNPYANITGTEKVVAKQSSLLGAFRRTSAAVREP